MAFSEEVEELEEDEIFSNVFGDNDEEEDEYEDPSEFDQYTQEETITRWGNLTFEDLVFELQNILGASKKYFFSKRKRVIDAEEMDNLLRVITEKLPGEIAQARETLEKRDRIISTAKSEASAIHSDAESYKSTTEKNANAKAAAIVKEAKDQAANLVAEHTITQSAEKRAREIITAANTTKSEIIQKTKQDAQNYINQVNQRCDKNLKDVFSYANAVLNKVNTSCDEQQRKIQESYSNAITENKNNMNAFRKTFENDFNEIRKMERYNPLNETNE